MKVDCGGGKRRGLSTSTAEGQREEGGGTSISSFHFEVNARRRNFHLRTPTRRREENGGGKRR
jgi:hypothetical protein